MDFRRTISTALVGISLITMGGIGTAKAETKSTGTINAYMVNMRQSNDLKAKILTRLGKGEKVTILSKSGIWVKISRDGKTGWVHSQFVNGVKASSSTGSTGKSTTTKNTTTAPSKTYKKAESGVVSATNVNVRTSPQIAKDNLGGRVNKGTKVKVTADQSGWYFITLPNGKKVWIHGKYVNIPKTPSKNTTPDKKSTPSKSTTPSRGADDSAGNGSGNVAEAIEIAKRQLGKPYVYGAAGPNSFDCTGFVTYVLKQFGYKLPRSAQAMGYGNWGVKLSRNQLKAGDIVFFNTISDGDLSDHAGIYLGGGQFIHSSSSKTSGKYVRISSLDSGYYQKVFSWGRRLPNFND